MIPEDEDLDPDYPDQCRFEETEEYYVDESHYDPYAGCGVYETEYLGDE